MRILAIETSCDDTGVAIVENGRKVLVNLVESQVQLHAPFGGVVPEIASREHLRSVYSLVDRALAACDLKPKDIDRIAVTQGPGLVGSLLVGFTAAQTLSFLWKKPLVPVNHLAGHIYSVITSGQTIHYPAVALLASGGHTEIVLIKAQDKFKLLGATRDDAAGEAFDKAATILGLSYPGGPAISQAAEGVEAGEEFLPRPMRESKDLDMSFSGLKTAIKREAPNRPMKIMAREVEEAITDSLAEKLAAAVSLYRPKQVIVVGGVAANKRLRQKLEALALPRLTFADMKYCTDNAAMIATAAYLLPSKSKKQYYNLDTDSSLSL